MAGVEESAVLFPVAHFQLLIAIFISVLVQMMEEEHMFRMQIKWSLHIVDFSMDQWVPLMELMVVQEFVGRL